MRIAALLVAAAACTPAPTHLSATVTIGLASDDPSEATVMLEGNVYQPPEIEGDRNQAVSGVDARIELDGHVIPLSEDAPGHHVGAPQQGFPQEIRLFGDDEALALELPPFSTATVDRSDERLSVTVNPRVQPNEWVLVIWVSQSDTITEPINASGATVEFPPGFARVVLTRGITTRDDDEGLRMDGYVVTRRELPVPRWSNDP